MKSIRAQRLDMLYNSSQNENITDEEADDYTGCSSNNKHGNAECVATINDLLKMCNPVVYNLMKYLDSGSIMAMSSVSKDWWSATSEVISKRFRLNIKPHCKATYRKHSRVQIQNDASFCEIPFEVEELTVVASKLPSLKMFERFPKLTKLELIDCTMWGEDNRCSTIRSFSYVTTASFPRYSWEFIRQSQSNKASGFDDFVFENLEECEFNFAPYKTDAFECCESLQRFIKKNSTVKRCLLAVPQVSKALLETIRTYTRVELLRITSPFQLHKYVPDAVFEYIDDMPSLKHLKLDNYQTDKVTTLNLEKYHSFEFTGEIELSRRELLDWLPVSTNLTTLTLSRLKCSELPMDAFAHCFPNLTTLYLGASFMNNCNVVSAGVFRNLTKLDWFVKSKRGNIHNVFAPKLESLKVFGSTVGANEIEHVLTNFPKLKVFDYYQYEQTDEICDERKLIVGLDHWTTIKIYPSSGADITTTLKLYAQSSGYYFEKIGKLGVVVFVVSRVLLPMFTFQSPKSWNSVRVWFVL